MGSTVSQFISGAGQASQYDAMKRMTLAKGQAEKNKAYAQATATEQASKQAAAFAGENMMRERANQRRAVGEARTAAAGSGFTAEGTGTSVADAVRRAYDMRVGDMATASSVNQTNSINQAIGMRRAGDEVMRAAESQAAQYRRMAKATRSALWINGITTATQIASGAISGYNDALDFNKQADAYNKTNATEIAKGNMTAKKHQSPWEMALLNADSEGISTANTVGGMNPFINNMFGSRNSKQSLLKKLSQ